MTKDQVHTALDTCGFVYDQGYYTKPGFPNNRFKITARTLRCETRKRGRTWKLWRAVFYGQLRTAPRGGISGFI